jgi:hypothetical protein
MLNGYNNKKFSCQCLKLAKDIYVDPIAIYRVHVFVSFLVGVLWLMTIKCEKNQNRDMVYKYDI